MLYPHVAALMPARVQNAVYPPSITKQSAVWYDDALLIRYTAMPPKSLGSPKRRIGIRGITAATNLSSASTRAVMSLLIQPGRMALAVTPWRASSTASARHSALIAALVAALCSIRAVTNREARMVGM